MAPFADARASDLALALGGEPRPALEWLRPACAGWEIELRILGCSHQVLVGADGVALSEVVACLPETDGALPDRLSSSCPGGDYSFFSRRMVLGRDVHERRSARLLKRLSAEPHALVGLFPGLPNAFTAIRCCASGTTLVWESWHSYPQTRELVQTASVLRRR